jgi:hypothetical protein
MKLQEVIDNLNRTIEGKERLLARVSEGEFGIVVGHYVEVNLNELRRIRDDLLKVKS